MKSETGLINKIHKIIRIVLIIIPALTLLWLINNDLVPFGRIEYQYDFSHDSAFIKRLWPPGRVLDIERDETGDYFQRMAIDPVYFDLKIPRSFQRANVIIKYQKPKEQVFKIGPIVSKEEWAFKLEPVEEKSRVEDWILSEASFDLAGVDMMDNKMKFLLSAPGLDLSNQEIKITDIKIQLERQPIWQNFWPRLKSYLKKL